MILKFKCAECDHVENFPEHCEGEQMEFDEGKGNLKCSTCGEEKPVPTHHDKPMKPFITSV